MSKSVRIKPLVLTLLVTCALMGGALYNGVVRADQFDDQINALNQQNASTRADVAQLGSEASGYQDQVNKYQQQIDALQQQIVDTQNKIDDKQKQIDDATKKLDEQKQILGDNIKAMYLEGDVTTLEILASSNDLSQFVDKEQYRTSVQNKVTDTVNTITALKVQLEDDQRVLQGLLADEQKQQNNLTGFRDQQAQLLSLTTDQINQKNAEIQANNSTIASLRAQQAAQNRKLGGVPVAGDPGHGGYPAVWNNAPQDSMIDNWGMYNRECVSYTAWKVYQTFGYMPYWGGVGNANQWPGDAQAAGIPTGSVPKVHSVAISMGGAFGHAMWVEAVSGSTIYVSQYNYDLQGHYSEMSINGSGLIYIYFGQ